MSILEELYNGNIRPSEKFIKKESEYNELFNQLNNKIDSFLLNLNQNEKKLFEEIDTTVIKLTDISQKEYFFEGLYIGANLILEIMNYTSANFEHL